MDYIIIDGVQHVNINTPYKKLIMALKTISESIIDIEIIKEFDYVLYIKDTFNKKSGCKKYFNYNTKKEETIDLGCIGFCSCKKEGLVHNHVLININTNKTCVVGSRCINHFFSENIKNMAMNEEKLRKFYDKHKEMLFNIGKYRGYTYDFICNDVDYIKFLKLIPKRNKKYDKLIKFYDYKISHCL